MTINKNQLYAVAGVLAAVSAILQFLERDWFRGATGAFLAATMALAATGFPEKSVANRRIYYGMLGVVIVVMSVRILARFR